jgi:tungstate transport system substrate-binding protein
MTQSLMTQSLVAQNLTRNMMMFKPFFRLLLTVLIACLAFALPGMTGADIAGAADKSIIVASTTSTQNSGLLDYLLPKFTNDTGIEVHLVAVGTGQAILLGERGDADVLLVHDKASELKFVAEGYGINRREVMYNDFIIVGPASDPAGIQGQKDASLALTMIAKAHQPFLSRGDNSGTHKEELRLWQAAGIDPKGASGGWYREGGVGMGATLNTASAMPAYTLTDRGTWLSFKNRGDLKLLVEGDAKLFNQYGIILVNPAKHPAVKAAEGQALIDWITSKKGQQLIAAYQINGQPLFVPNYKAPNSPPNTKDVKP